MINVYIYTQTQFKRNILHFCNNTMVTEWMDHCVTVLFSASVLLRMSAMLHHALDYFKITKTFFYLVFYQGTLWKLSFCLTETIYYTIIIILHFSPNTVAMMKFTSNALYIKIHKNELHFGLKTVCSLDPFQHLMTEPPRLRFADGKVGLRNWTV